MTPETKRLFDEAEAVLAAVNNWREVDTAAEESLKGKDVRAFEGSAHGWTFVVTEFGLEPQGGPKGSRGCDGGLRNTMKGVVAHMTPELAREASAAAVFAIEGVPQTVAKQHTADGMPLCDRHVTETGLQTWPEDPGATPQTCQMCITRPSYGRTCDYCDRMLHPRWPAVYCSNQCAKYDA